MSRATRSRFRPIAAFDGLIVWSLALLLAGPARAEDLGARPQAAANPVPDETLARGRELFSRGWMPNDPRSHGGDGLGPVYNERSCLGCHNQGGAGGGAAADKNIEIVSPSDSGSPGNGAFYSFGMSFGSAGFQYRFVNNASPTPRPRPLNLADLAQIHAGFREAPSVILHRFGPDADYRAWRESIPGQHRAIFLQTSQRNS